MATIVDSERAEMLDLCARLCLSPQILDQDSDMAACYVLTNPRDSAINITGFPMGGPYQTNQPIRSSPRISSSATSSAVLGQRSGQRNVANGERYVPVLTVKRRAGPTTVTAPVSSQEDVAMDIASQNVIGNKSFAFGRPTPPVDCFQSRTPIAQRARKCSRSQGASLFHRPLTDVRTGFMRTMSKPTPGELDLKHHQEKQALDKLKADLRREQEALEDPDRLNMNDIIRLVDERHRSTYAHRLRPRAAKRRVAHASLVARDADVEGRSQDYEESTEKDVQSHTQTAINEYKHRLHALSAQMRSGKDRAKTAVTRYSHTSGSNDVDRQSLRLAPNYNDRLMSIQLLSLPDPSGRTSPQGSVDGHSSKSFPMQSRLTPRSSASLSMRDMTSLSSARKSRQPLYPDPIYIPSATEDWDAQARIKLSMHRTSNVTRETSLMSDMDPQNSHSNLTVRLPFPQPTMPPSNTPVSDFYDEYFGDEDSLVMNWSSRSCSRLSGESLISRTSGSRSTTPSTGVPPGQSKETEIKVVVPSLSI